MERPFVGPVLALMAGMLISDLLPLPAQAGLALGLIGLFSWWLPRGSSDWRLRFACLLVGWGHHAVWSDASGPRDAAAVISSEPVLGWVRGRVVDPGEHRLSVAGLDRTSRTIELNASGWCPRSGVWVPMKGVLRIRFRDSRGVEPVHDQEAEVFGAFGAPELPLLPGSFDYGAHLRARRILRVGQSDGSSDWRPVTAVGSTSWSHRFMPWAHGTLSQGLPDDAAARLIRSMVLGWRGGLEDEWREAFLESGTLHVFAISGLHIALVAGLLVQVLRLVRVERAWCGWIVLPVVWFYVAATGWQASAVRSAVMSSVVVLGWSLRRPSDLLNSLAASAWLILWQDPGQLFQAGFQLSFGVVAGMAIWSRPMEGWMGGFLEPDPLIPEASRSRLWRWFSSPARWIRVNLSASAAAWVTSLPLVVHYFHLISLSALLANLVVVPVSGLCLVAGLISLAVAPVSSTASEWMNQSAWVWMRGMMEAGAAASRVPGGDWKVAAPDWGWWVVYGWILFGVLPLWVNGRRIPCWRVWLPGLAAVFAGILIWRQSGTTVLTCLPWGAGILVEQGWTREQLIDVGPSYWSRRILPEWLGTRGINRLDDAIAAAGESRFAGGWPGLFEGVAVDAWWTGPEGRNGGALRLAHDAAHARGIPVRRLLAGRRVGPWEVLWPPADAAGIRSDDQALVLRGELGGVTCCVIPSLNPEAQAGLLARVGVRLKSDLVIAGMPGRGEPLTPALLEALDPQAVVVLAGERPATHRVPRNVRDRLRRAVPDGVVWFTDQVGVVTVRCRSGLCRLSCLRGHPGMESGGRWSFDVVGRGR
jgi:ComEC/Rec2-related protein